MDFSLSNPVRLVVKAPNQQIADQTIECALGWTVKKLKEHLSSVYPSKPREKEQKLIYSGKLLQDHLMLKDILRQYGDETQHTLHLVCSPSKDRPKMNTERPNPKTPSPSSSQAEGLRHRRPETTPVPSTTSSQNQSQQYQGYDEQTAAMWNQYLSQMGQQANMGNPQTAYMGHPGAANMAHPAMGHAGAAHMAHPAMGHPMAAHMAHPAMGHAGAAHMAHPAMAYMNYNPQQYYYMQQMYTQYMQQYMQYYQQTATGGSPPASPQPNLLPQQQNAVNQPVNQRNPQQPANQNIRMNAQGGPVDDDDEDEFGQRDWLDWVYTFSRFGVLLSIVYFYSTMSRFIMVFLFFLVVYLYDKGFFNLRRREGAEAQAPPIVPEAAAPEPAAAPQEEASPTPEDSPDNNTSNETMENTENEAQDTQESSENTGDNSENMGDNSGTAVPEEPQPGALRVFWCFISTFFTSLIPQPPPAVNAN